MKAALVGIVTLHLAFGAILGNFPERADDWAQTYIATSDCGEIGKRYILILGNEIFRATVADCLAEEHRGANREEFGGFWIADVGERAWKDRPWIPQRASLWEVPVWESYQWKMERIK